MILRTRKLPKGLAIAAQSAEFWRRLAPELTISDAQPHKQITRTPEQSATERMRLVNEGYLHLQKHRLDVPMSDIADAMDRIAGAGLPAAFIGVYDEVWSLIAQLSGVIDGLFDGKAALLPDFWASHLTSAGTGKSAGRKHPGKGVYANGMPKTATVWIPVTDATPDNGCVYIVPADQDRNYGKSEPARADASLPAIRALPAKAGDALIWTGEAYTWQGRPNRHANAPVLQSLVWEFQNRDQVPVGGHVIDSFPYVPFETRLAILAQQMHRYGRQVAVNPVWRAVHQTLANRFPIGR